MNGIGVSLHGMSEKPIRVCIIEDHAVVRAGLRMLIETKDGMAVVGEAANRVEAFAAATKNPPDIFILDLDLDDESGLDFLPDLISTCAGARVLVLTSATDMETHHQAIEAGALGLVLKAEASEVLLHAIEKVHSGEVWLTRSQTASVLSRIAQGSTDDAESRKIQSLTKREREIVALVAHGFKRSQIADSLFISETTVRNHLTSILSKLEVTDTFDLVFYAYRHGLAKPPR
ncbi:MAG: DNA-binding response regulator [Acidobacteria bacterium]|nr:MAG: DNA-binding response regulator [Acidobacteriota bacterium]